MAERASVFQVTQLGLETTPGTSVAANRRLQAVSIEPAIKAEVSAIRPTGVKFPTGAAPGREWVEASISGMAAYNDLAYLLASVLMKATPAQQGTTTAYLWTFTPAQAAADTVATYTVETGSSVRAGKFTYGLVTKFTLKADRNTVEVGGSLIGRAYQDGITMTGSPTQVALQPVLPTHVSVYADDTSGALGTTKLTRLLSAELSISNRFGTLWTLDAAESAWVAHVELQPTATLKLLVEADAQGMGLLTTMRAGSKKYIRLKAVGPVIEGIYNYTLQCDLAGTVTDVGEFSDQDGVYAIEWTLQATYDSAWGKALEVALTNTLTAL